MSGGNEVVRRQLREAGWVHIGDVVRAVGITRSAIRKWIANGQVDRQKFFGDSYIAEDSLYRKLGAELSARHGYRNRKPQPPKGPEPEQA